MQQTALKRLIVLYGYLTAHGIFRELLQEGYGKLAVKATADFQHNALPQGAKTVHTLTFQY